MNETVLLGDRNVMLECTEGETFRCFVEFTEEDGTTPVNLLGAQPRIHIKRTDADTTPVYSLAVDDGLTLAPFTGRVGILLSSLQTNDKVGTYVWDIRVQFSNGDVMFLAGGRFRVLRAVTDLESGEGYVPPCDFGPFTGTPVIRQGMTLRVRARGPVILPVPVGSTGPFAFIDVLLGSGYVRVSPDPLAMGLKFSTGTGTNAVERLDFTKPNGETLGAIMAAGPGFAWTVGDEDNAIPYLDLRRDNGTILRIRANSENANALEFVNL